MPSVLFLGDSHFDEGSRFDECIAVHDRIADIARDNSVDLVVHCGDVFEGPRTASLAERAAFRAWAQRITETATLVVIRGNHDPRGELAEMAKFLPDFHAIEEAEVLYLPYGREGRTIALAGIAWPNRAQLLASAPSRTDGEASLAEALRSLFLGMRTELDAHQGPKFAAAHAMVRGSLTSAGQPLVGCDVENGAEDLALLGVELVVLGHIHKGQSFEVGDTEIIYTGSPRRTAFGEVEEKDVILAVFADDGALLRRLWIPTGARPMVLIEGTLGGGEVGSFVVADADVRIRITCDAGQQIEAEQVARAGAFLCMEGGAHSVKTEIVVRPETTARAPEVAEAPSLAAKLDVLWKARNAVPEGDEREALNAMIAEIEEVA
jgi:DNA repair protein SbcD/Mre11